MLNPLSANTLSSSQTSLLKTMQQLSSGQQINSAADNPAGLAVAVSLSAQAVGLQQASANIGSALDVANTASGALGQVGDTLQQLRDLAVQAGNGSLTAGDRQTLADQFNQLAQQLDQVAGGTQFNGQNLLDGSFSLQVQTGADSGQAQSLQLGNVGSASLGVGQADLSSAATASAALDVIDTALAALSVQQANVGAFSAGLEAAQANAETGAISAASARSAVADTDYAAAVSDLAKNRVQNQASLSALAMYNDIQKQSTLGLLK